ncbi:gamma-glutamyl-gamma-aminobutyrate hydrolase family protein [Rhodococcus koreensis]|uniref:Putative glutamine amidotransferase n=1 Tax=Rhodococcus koreensis TaxID=99653 RepID=A0A1H4MBU0_9NOCA|nr:gamma-glutamyl-gamma-aminobutyrate hydrolase family protein [Rhodococcus koreensis]SEB80403.1 putative glutamine amidotransferase [Rhodococcus koreensis]
MDSANSGRVKVGIVVGVEHGDFGMWKNIPTAMLPTTYVEAVRRAGGTALLFPADGDVAENPDQVLDLVDAVILAGGRDIGPATYGHSAHAATAEPDTARDLAELAVARRALELDIPILGICRGMQLLNVAFGGTLDQHVPDSLAHDDHAAHDGVFGKHEVTLVPDTDAAGAYQSDTATVYSAHHQGVGRLGAGLTVSARSVPDGVIEAIESPAHAFALGVLWHPEQDPTTPLFRAFLDHIDSRARHQRTGS